MIPILRLPIPGTLPPQPPPQPPGIPWSPTPDPPPSQEDLDSLQTQLKDARRWAQASQRELSEVQGRQDSTEADRSEASASADSTWRQWQSDDLRAKRMQDKDPQRSAARSQAASEWAAYQDLQSQIIADTSRIDNLRFEVSDARMRADHDQQRVDDLQTQIDDLKRRLAAIPHPA